MTQTQTDLATRYPSMAAVKARIAFNDATEKERYAQLNVDALNAGNERHARELIVARSDAPRTRPESRCISVVPVPGTHQNASSGVSLKRRTMTDQERIADLERSQRRTAEALLTAFRAIRELQGIAERPEGYEILTTPINGTR
jgi:hypothetical protein